MTLNKIIAIKVIIMTFSIKENDTQDYNTHKNDLQCNADLLNTTYQNDTFQNDTLLKNNQQNNNEQHDANVILTWQVLSCGAAGLLCSLKVLRPH